MAQTSRFCMESFVKKLLLLSLLIFPLSACQVAGTIYNAGHKVTSIMLDDRSFKDDLSDSKLNFTIRNALAKKDIKYVLDIELTIFEGVVLLNGALPNTSVIDEVVETVWNVNGVKKVYNYIRINAPNNQSTISEDAAISAKIRYELSITKGVSSSNYKITMDDGTIYLMGIAEDEEELKKVISIIKNTPSISKITTLVRFKNQSY